MGFWGELLFDVVVTVVVDALLDDDD
jgi:hypothetical protein